MLRRSLLSIALGGILLSAGLAVAAPKYVRLAHPKDASSGMLVAWTTTTGTAEAVVQYGTAKTSLTQTVKGSSKKVSATLGTVSEVTLSKLSPKTTYYYRVGGPAGGYSPTYSFTTGPAKSQQCGSFRFAVVGDSRAETWDKGTSNNYNLHLKSLAKLKPTFLWHGGDFVHDGKKDKQYDNLLKASSVFSSQVPIMYAVGNHDDGTPAGAKEANFNAVFHLPKSAKALGGSGTEDFHYFTVGNAIFIVLSTESFSSGSPKFKQQADWMDKVLTANPRRWKFAILHRPIYTEFIKIFGQKINHPPNEAGHNAAFVPVFNKHGVDMVFQSHNHFYERYAPSKCKNGGSTKPCPAAKGTIYVTTGGGGAFPIACPLVCPGPTNSVRLKASSEQHLLLLDIKDHTLKFQMINIQGKVKDTLTLTKPKGSPDPCAMPPKPDLGADSALPDGPTADAPLAADGLAADGPNQADGKPAADTKAGQDIKPVEDGKGTADTASQGDNAAPPVAAQSCSCRVDGAPGLGALGVLLLGVVLLRRRRKG